MVCSITTAGMDAVESFWSVRAARIESLVDRLSDEELEIVVPALKILSDATRRPNSDDEIAQLGISDRAMQIEEARV